MYDGDIDKTKYYKLAKKMFYHHYNYYFKNEIVVKYKVPYDGIMMPVLYTKAVENKKDTIILHGGNDSYMEELFFPMLYLSQKGFDVYLFEGPGQGEVVRIQKKKFIYQWEKPVKTLLDFFNIKDVTIIGVSLGGMLAPRAAAYEKRIKTIVAWSIFPNFLSVILSTGPKAYIKVMRFLIKFRLSFILNLIVNISAKKDSTIEWGIKHGMYSYDAKSPYDYVKKLNKFQITNIGNLIDKDILVIGGNRDHFINYKLFKDELDALSNVSSLTFKLLTDSQYASSHCNIGNTKLVLDIISNWIDNIKNKY